MASFLLVVIDFSGVSVGKPFKAAKNAIILKVLTSLESVMNWSLKAIKFTASNPIFPTFLSAFQKHFCGKILLFSN